jgi:two-component system sensor histidine kinase VanS
MMKFMSIKYQFIVSIILLITLVFATIYIGLNVFMPRVYESQIQSELKKEIIDLDILIKNSSETMRTFNISAFTKASPYNIDIYTLTGSGLYDSIGKELTTQTKISLLQGPIVSRFFDGSRGFYTRIETTDLFIIQVSFDVESFEQFITVMNTLTIYLGLIGFFIAIIISFIFGSYMTKPIISLSKDVLNNTTIKPLKRYDEIGTLSRSLAQYQEDINQLIIKLKNELEREKDQDILMKTFIANTSHEIQTPLSIMLVAVETLEDKILGQSDQIYTHMIKTEIKHLEHLIKDMMILSLSSSNKLEIVKTTHDLNTLFEEIKKQMTLIYPNAHIYMKLPMKKTMIFCDRAKIKQVFYNVIINALTHQKTTSDVKIELRIDKEDVFVSVCNPNSYIDEKHMPHIFDTFYKVDSKGKGLGLAIVKTVLDGHGFTYAYENKLNGVCFSVHMEKNK